MSDRLPTPLFRVRELELRYRPQRLDTPFPSALTDPGDAARLAATLVRDCAMEVVLVLHLTVKRQVLGVHRLPGTTDQVVVSMGDICRAALLSNATGIIVAHNHLSGDPEPSGADREFVQRLRNALRILDLELLDALIVVDPVEGSRYYSFREEGLL